jgi:CHAT domain-containing protein
VAAQEETNYRRRGNNALLYDQLDSAGYWFTQLGTLSHPDSVLESYSGLIRTSIRKTELERGDSLMQMADSYLRMNRVAPLTEIRYLSTRGEFLRANSNAQAGLDQHLAVLKMIDRSAHDATSTRAHTLLNIGMSYEQMSRYDSALAYVQQSIPLFEQVYDTTEAAFSNIYNSLAVCYYRTNQYEEAKKYYELCIDIARKKIGPNSVDLGNSLNNLSGIYRFQEDYEKAIAVTEEALQIFQNLENQEGISRSYYALGVYYYFLGDYGRSRDYLEACLAIRKTLYAPDHFRLIDPLNVLAIAQEEAGNYDATLDYLRKGRAVIQANYGEQNISMGYNLENTALAFVAMERYDSAWHYIQQATTILPNQLGPNDYGLWVHYFSIARIQYYRGNYREALSALDRSDAIGRQLGLDQGIDFAQNITVRADILTELGQFAEAENYLDEALDMVITNRQEPLQATSFHLAPTSLQVLHAHTNFHFRNYRQRSDKDALNEFRAMAGLYQDISNAIRRQFDDPYTKRILSRNNASTSRQTIGQLGYLYRQTQDERYLDDIFQLIEYNRASQLRDLQDRKVSSYAGLPDSMLIRERGLRQKVTDLESRYLNEPENEEIQAQLFATREDLNQFIDLLRQQFPRYYQLVFSDRIPDLSVIQERLEAAAGVIEYVRDDTAYYAITITPTSADLQYLGPQATIDSLIRAWHTCIQQQCSDWQRISHQLYQRIWHPFSNKLSTENGTLTVVPAGMLYYVSLEGLVTDLESGRFLMEVHPIHYSFSLTTKWSPDERRANGPLIAIAPGFEPGLKEAYRQKAPSGQTDRDYLQTIRQPWSLRLARTLGRRSGSKSLTGERATENNVKDLLPKGRILFFGTHAQADSEDPMRSRLLLAKKPDSTDTEDGYLHAHELYGIPLQADLAILNACESGLGALQEGEGMISLAYSMQYAGCPSTVMSLWKIDERTSTRLTEQMLKYLGRGKTRIQALRRAKMDYLRSASPDQRHPYYWSGLVLMGQEGAMPGRRRASPLWWVVLGIVVTGLVIIYWFRLRNQEK